MKISSRRTSTHGEGDRRAGPLHGLAIHGMRALAAPLGLALAVATGMSLGLALPVPDQTYLILWPAVFVQTIVSVGALRPTWITSAQARNEAFFLLAVHHVIGTVPYVVAWLLLSSDVRNLPLVLGILCLAIVPTASGLPASATAARASPITITGFACASYVLALVATPLLGLRIFGAGSRFVGLAASICFGLILPALLALLLGRWIRRIPPATRTWIVMVAMVGTTFVFGGSLAEALSSLAVPGVVMAAALVAGAARVGLSAVVSLLFTIRRPGLRLGTAMSSSYKNDALAASIALQAGGPLAVLPAEGHLLAEMVLMLAISGLAARRSVVDGSADRAIEGDSVVVR